MKVLVTSECNPNGHDRVLLENGSNMVNKMISTPDRTKNNFRGFNHFLDGNAKRNKQIDHCFMTDYRMQGTRFDNINDQ